MVNTKPFQHRLAHALVEIHHKHKTLFDPTTTKSVLDLMAYPGSWIEAVHTNVQPMASCIGFDFKRTVYPPPGPRVLYSTFNIESESRANAFRKIKSALAKRHLQSIDCVLLSGATRIPSPYDQHRIALQAASLSVNNPQTQPILRPGGSMVIMVQEQRYYTNRLMLALQSCFEKVETEKPAVLDPKGNHVCIVALGLRVSEMIPKKLLTLSPFGAGGGDGLSRQYRSSAAQHGGLVCWKCIGCGRLQTTQECEACSAG
eukprot:PhF_6_TR8072/c0_g1_i1/m.12492/K14857/SPB1, FTSJ3; AdoMet-dependent rRNA methyltransferase SPB1